MAVWLRHSTYSQSIPIMNINTLGFFSESEFLFLIWGSQKLLNCIYSINQTITSYVSNSPLKSPSTYPTLQILNIQE